MPTYRVGADVEQNPIRLKNRLDAAQEQLIAGGMDKPAAEELLQPARQLLSDEVYWQHQSDGLALFLSPEMQRAYRMPYDFEALTVVADRFHLKPLLPLLSGNGQFYLLTLSQKGVKLYQGSKYSVSQVPTEDVPESLFELLDYDELDYHMQFHTKSRTPGGKPATREGVFHGHNVGEADRKEDIFKYFQKVDDALEPLLRDGGRPLVLAGVDYLLPIYREANSYEHLADDEIEGSPDEWTVEELHEMGWEIVAPIFKADREEAEQLYQQLLGKGADYASHDLAEIVPAAYFERVEVLFVAVDEQRWGAFDPESGEIETHEEPQPGDEDLLDLAALHTLLNSGAIYADEPEALPDGASIAALFRYEL
jgi:hypothetical protein